MFVSGAYTGNQARSVERYDTFTDAWRNMSSLNVGRSFHASCSAKSGHDQSESVYVFCGFQKTKDNTLTSVEKLLHPEKVTSRWQLIELGKHLVPCWYHGAVVLNN